MITARPEDLQLLTDLYELTITAGVKQIEPVSEREHEFGES